MHKYRVQRVLSLGRDRHHSQYYFFDGLGGADLSLGTGRLFVRHDNGDWACYSSPEEVDALAESLNDKGVREFALKHALLENYDRITDAMRRRQKVRTPRRSQDSVCMHPSDA